MNGRLIRELTKLAVRNAFYPKPMLNTIIFYTLDKAIKQYRQFAQANIDRAGLDITVDQWLVLTVIQEAPDLGQADIAVRVFKDQASVARIIDLLVKKHLIYQTASQTDRRRIVRKLTTEGKQLLQDVAPIIMQNRAIALRGLAQTDIEQLRGTLETIFNNCRTADQAAH
jgi:DNA-binding MarR family transcriptional regulator